MVTSLAFLGVVAEKARLHEGICSARRDPHVTCARRRGGYQGSQGQLTFLHDARNPPHDERITFRHVMVGRFSQQEKAPRCMFKN